MRIHPIDLKRGDVIRVADSSQLILVKRVWDDAQNGRVLIEAKQGTYECPADGWAIVVLHVA